MKKFIPDCYWPGINNGTYVSHEAVCLLNPTEQDADVTFTMFFEDRPKIGGIHITVPAERTIHVRMDRLTSPEGNLVKKDTPYALMIESEAELPVQYTRVDTTQPELALMTTIV